MTDQRNEDDMLIELVGWLEEKRSLAAEGFNIDFSYIDGLFAFPNGFTKDHLSQALEALQYRAAILGNVSARVQSIT